MAWPNFPAVELDFSLIFLIWIIYRFLTSKKSNSNKEELGLPPGPRPWPWQVVGNLHLLASSEKVRTHYVSTPGLGTHGCGLFSCHGQRVS
ncbi:hypothetical protein SUGI_0958250 [Cryptomeria japonica]|nr:hypothetical protein SUGI_0958250 [Cryptomeria japonica]